MCRWRSVVAAVMVGLGPAALAQEDIHIEANLDCGQWVSARTAKQGNVYEGYLLGIINGMAIGAGIEFWRARGVPVNRQQVFLWMDNYCRANPLKSAVTGAFVLFNERTDNALSKRP